MPECRCSALYQVKNSWLCSRACSIDPNLSGKSGRYLSVLYWASENGLSFEQRGREWLLATPRSARSSATVREAHRGAAVGVDGQLVAGDALLGDRVTEQPFGQPGV